MKPMLSTIVISLAMLVAACAPLQASQPLSVELPTATQVTQPVVNATSQVEVSSADVISLPTLTATANDGSLASSGSEFPKDGITLSDNGKTYVTHIGESFLLNLGTEGYDWTVEVSNQNVLHRELNVMPILGAQGIYVAENPGTAVLTATGDPLCRQSKPACMRPSILFSITVIVE
jgi:hypothetical protein